jgi:hypothetical protein
LFLAALEVDHLDPVQSDDSILNLLGLDGLSSDQAEPLKNSQDDAGNQIVKELMNLIQFPEESLDSGILMLYIFTISDLYQSFKINSYSFERLPFVAKLPGQVW